MIFKKFSDGKIFTLNKNDLIIENDILQFTEEIKPDLQMPTILEFLYINKDKNYKISTITIKDENRINDIVHGIKTQIAFTEVEANNIAYKIFQHFLSRKKYFKFKLPLIYDNIEINDIIEIEKELIRIIKIEKTENYIYFEGYSTIISYEESIINKNQYDDKKLNLPLKINKTEFKVFEFHNIYNNINQKLAIQIATKGLNENWNGCNVYISYDDEENYYFLEEIKKKSIIGILISNLNSSVDFGRVDKKNKIIIYCEDANISSISNKAFFNFEQIALIGNEIIAFKNVNKIGDNKYELSFLLRGCFNTENQAFNHQISENFILLNDLITEIELPISLINKNIFIKAVSFNENIYEVSPLKIQIYGKSIKNFDIVHKIQYLSNQENKIIKWQNRRNIKLQKSGLLLSDINSNIKFYKNNKIIQSEVVLGSKINTTASFDNINIQNILSL